MKKIKRAIEYLQNIFNPDNSLPLYDVEDLQLSITLNPELKYFEEAIKQAQIDAIDAAVERCAEEAECTSVDMDGFYNVDKQSILLVADKLIKEL